MQGVALTRSSGGRSSRLMATVDVLCALTSHNDLARSAMTSACQRRLIMYPQSVISQSNDQHDNRVNISNVAGEPIAIIHEVPADSPYYDWLPSSRVATSDDWKCVSMRADNLTGKNNAVIKNRKGSMARSAPIRSLTCTGEQ